MKQAVAVLGLTLASLSVMAADESKGQITDARVDAAFKKADKDKNGTLSLTEAQQFGITKKAFEHANPDKDGSLDKKEFVAAVTYQFEKANPDKDATLDSKEAAAAGIKSKATFDKANPDKDGTLDLAEYLQALILTAK
jgi:Ca2+-binding EF-hand superfamily protein